MLTALAIDVEDYVHTKAITSAVTRARSQRLERRAERNTWKFSELPGPHKVIAAKPFPAKRCPNLVPSAAAGGHELACYRWRRQVNHSIQSEVRDTPPIAKNVLGAWSGQPMIGYRAPSLLVFSYSTPVNGIARSSWPAGFER